MWRCVTPRLVRGRDAMGDDDVLTPFIEQYYDVFMTHVLPRVNAPVMMCPCGGEDATPPSLVAHFVLGQVSRTFRRLIPGFRETCEAHADVFKKWASAAHRSERYARVMSLLSSSPSIRIREWLREYVDEDSDDMLFCCHCFVPCCADCHHSMPYENCCWTDVTICDSCGRATCQKCDASPDTRSFTECVTCWRATCPKCEASPETCTIACQNHDWGTCRKCEASPETCTRECHTCGAVWCHACAEQEFPYSRSMCRLCTKSKQPWQVRERDAAGSSS